MTKSATKDIEENQENLPEVTSAPKGITDEEILDLKLRGFSHQRIADILGCSKANITQRLREYKTELEGLSGFKKNRADIFAVHQARALKHVTEAKLKEASVRDLTVFAGTLYDKERQERGQEENKNSVSIILNLAHQASENEVIDIEVSVDK